MKNSSVLIIISAVFFGTYGIWSKLMGGIFGEFNQAWIRAVMILAILLPLGFIFKSYKKIRNEDIKWFTIISLAGGLNQAPYYFGFQHLSVGTATLLFYLALTLGAFVVGKFFFNEKITKIKQISLFLSVIGLAVIYKLTLMPDQVIPAISTLLAGILGAIYIVFSKKISTKYSEIQILTVVFVTMLVTNLPISVARNEIVPMFSETVAWFGQLGYVAAMVLANAAVVAGFRKIEPSIGGLLGLLEVVFAAIFGAFLFREAVTIPLLVGSTLILLSASLPDLMKQAENLIRKKVIHSAETL